MKGAGVVLVLLLAATSAFAQDVWMLWAQEEGPEAEMPRWQVKVAVPSPSACEKAMRDEIRSAKRAFVDSHEVGYKVADTSVGWTGMHDEGGIAKVDIQMKYQCLPDTQDPRRPGGK
jgi:hypothetical protein